MWHRELIISILHRKQNIQYPESPQNLYFKEKKKLNILIGAAKVR